MTTAARLRELIATLEHDLGLRSLSASELDVLYVVRLLSDDVDNLDAEAADIRDHMITAGMSQPTLNRAIRSLIDKGYLEPAPNYKTKRYRLRSKS